MSQARYRKGRPRIASLSAVLLCLACGCSTTDDGGNPGSGGNGGCPDGERLVDGECVPNRPGTRDAGTDGGNGGGGEDTSTGVDLSEGCEPSTRVCEDTATVAICESDGTILRIGCTSSQNCMEGFCIETGGCTPDANLGCHDEGSFRVCNATGEGFDVIPCPSETPNCLGGIDGCTDWACIPRTTRCSSAVENAVETCAEDGSGWSAPAACGGALACEAGECLSPCEENAKVTSFLGCDYWALDLDNIEEECDIFGECLGPNETCNVSTNVCEPSAASQQFSISVSNPNEDPVNVTVTNFSNMAESTVTVGPQTVQAIPMARLDVNGTGLTNNAFHVTTDLPVTIHQFNPANNVGVFSNDASLLLPSNSGGLEYIVLGWPTGPFGAPGGTALSYAAVVAVGDDGATTVSVTPTVDIQVGVGVNAMLAGSTSTVSMRYGQVLSLQTRPEENRDLSGTIITADQPILVFAGHECAFVLDEDPTPFCDHIEQQLYPVEAWGTEYIAAKLHPRGTEIDVYRVVAAQDGTSLSTTPAVSGVDGRTVNRGEVLEFTTNQSFRLTSGGAPILLGQFMTGSNYPGIPTTCFQALTAPDEWCSGGGFETCPPGYTCDRGPGYCSVRCSSASECQALVDPSVDVSCGDGYCAGGTGVGDPAFMLAVPVNQYRDNYIFLTPSDYREDWISVIAPTGTQLTLDGSSLSTGGLTPVGDTGFGVYYHDTSNPPGGSDPAASHTITGTAPFALQVYGYDCDVSYAYPGGLNLEPEEE